LVLSLGNTEPLPPITSKPKPKATAIGEKDENGKPTSYQLVFDQVKNNKKKEERKQAM
jgi:hypothetical protein